MESLTGKRAINSVEIDKISCVSTQRKKTYVYIYNRRNLIVFVEKKYTSFLLEGAGLTHGSVFLFTRFKYNIDFSRLFEKYCCVIKLVKSIYVEDFLCFLHSPHTVFCCIRNTSCIYILR